MPRPKKPDFLQPIPCPDCGQTFTPVNVNQKRCTTCIAEANKKVAEAQKQARIKAEIEAMHKKHPPANHNPVGMATCAVCGKEFEAKNLRNAKYCSDECRKSTKTKTHRDKKETVSDNQKLVWVKCKNPECPNGGKFQTTWEKYRKGAAYCNKECNYRAKYLQSKKYQRDQEEKRAQAPVQEVLIDYAPHDGQKIFHASTARFRVLDCANRWGKDRCSINEFIRLFVEMLNESRPSTLVPRVMGWIVAPTYKLARQNWRELKHFMPEQWIVSKNEAEKQLETVGDGLIEVKSADDPESLVSVGLDIMLMTEVARAKNLQDIWGNLFARLSSKGRGPKGQGGVGIFNSSPLGRNFFYTMYQWGQDPLMPEWESWKFDCYSSPYLTPENIDIAKRTLPDRLFRQNWLAEFLTDGGEVFVNIDKLSVGEIEEPKPGVMYKAAWDPAQRGDLSVFGIRDQFGRQVYKRVFTGMLYEEQLNIIEVHCKRYNHAFLDIDMTSGGETLPREAQKRGLNAEGIYWAGGGNIKQSMVAHLCVLMEQEAIILLNDEMQKEELKSYEYKITSSNRVKYSAPSGQHDDHVSMLIMLYRDFNESVLTLPYVGLLLGGRRGANAERRYIVRPEPRRIEKPMEEKIAQLQPLPPTSDMYRDMCIHQGYVPATCTLPGPIAWGLVNKGEDPCAGCNGDRSVCNGRPQNPELYKVI